MLKKIFRDIRTLYAMLRREKREVAKKAGVPSLFAVLDEIDKLPPESPKLATIALTHPVPEIAGRATERLKSRRLLRVIASSQEAQRAARIIAIARLQSDEELFVELAIRDDDPVVARFAAHHVKSAGWIADLRWSKYETVRLVVVMECDNPEIIRIMLDDNCPEIKARAQLRLRELIEGFSKN